MDGTTNFVHRFPFVCISIGLTIGKFPTVGVVYNLIIGELFTTPTVGTFPIVIPIEMQTKGNL